LNEYPKGDYRDTPVPTSAAHAPAVVRQVFNTLLDVFLLPTSRRLSDDGRWLTGENGRPLARFVDGGEGSHVEAIERLGSTSAHRLVRYMVGWQHAHFRFGGRRGALPPVEGGIDGLCRFMGVKGGRFRRDVRLLLPLFAKVMPMWADEVEEPLIVSLTLPPAGRSKKGSPLLRLQTTDAVAPHFLTTNDGAERRLTGRNAFRPPIPRRMPPSSRPNEAAASSTIELRLVRALRDAGAQVLSTGGLTLHMDELEQIAASASTSVDVVTRTLALWQTVQLTAATVRVIDLAPTHVTLGFGEALEAMYMKEGADLSLVARKRQAFGEDQKRARRGRSEGAE